LWRAETILRLLAEFEPAMYSHLQSIAQAVGTREFTTVLKQRFPSIEGKSIDYAVLERSPNLLVVAAPFDWDDVGNWSSLPRLIGTDSDRNTIQGKHLGIDTRGCIIRGSPDHLVVTVGLEDCLVVHTPDATLIARRDDEEKIREVVSRLAARGDTDYL
jgi:mannose-1-phosphate guanylyltransferase